MQRDHKTAFSRRLRYLMERRGLSAKSLLWLMNDQTGSAAKIYVWMNGKRLPSLESVYALRKALKCSWEELLGNE